jgi:hypothetical protein
VRWSCTPFFNELDLLEIRLATLDDWADRHIVAESRLTQTGLAKELHFDRNLDRFDPWLDKIEYVVVDDMPSGDWQREAHQRDAIARGLDGLKDSDLVLISDLDEIPNPRKLGCIQHASAPTRLAMAMHVYFLNWRWPNPPVEYGTRATVAMGYQVRESSPHKITVEAPDYQRPLDNAGWHCAYMGDVEGICRKIEAIADDFRHPGRLDYAHIDRCRRSGSDIFGRDVHQAEWVPDEEVPPYAVENRERFAHLFLPRPHG